VRKFEILKTTEPLTEGKIDPIAQMCMDIENDCHSNTSAVYGGIGCGMKITNIEKENNAE